MSAQENTKEQSKPTIIELANIGGRFLSKYLLLFAEVVVTAAKILQQQRTIIY
jgi:hypothetical protein